MACASFSKIAGRRITKNIAIAEQLRLSIVETDTKGRESNSHYEGCQNIARHTAGSSGSGSRTRSGTTGSRIGSRRSQAQSDRRTRSSKTDQSNRRSSVGLARTYRCTREKTESDRLSRGCRLSHAAQRSVRSRNGETSANEIRERYPTRSALSSVFKKAGL